MLPCICKGCQCDLISALAIIEAERQLAMLELEDAENAAGEPTEDAQ